MRVSILKLNKEKYSCKIDAEDFIKFSHIHWIAKPQYHGNKYYVMNNKGNLILSRLITNCPHGMVVDHINGDTLDNRKINLRICTQQQNLFNRKVSVRCSSQLKGVKIDKRRKRPYVARITMNGKEKFLGSFYSPLEAKKMYNKTAKLLFKEYFRS